MSLTIHFRSDVQEFTERHFPKEVPISIYGKVTGLTGLGEPYQHVRIEILDNKKQSIFFDEDTSNMFGDYAFYVIFPNVDGLYTIIVTATYSITGQDSITVPVAVGDAQVTGEAPKPLEQGSTLTKYIPYALGLGFVLLILYGAKTVKQIAT